MDTYLKVCNKQGLARFIISVAEYEVITCLRTKGLLFNDVPFVIYGQRTEEKRLNVCIGFNVTMFYSIMKT